VSKVGEDVTQINLPYGDGLLPINILDTSIGEVVSPHSVSAASDPEALVQATLAKPIGTPPLERLVRPGQKVSIIIDDITRETPANLMLPPVLERLLATGVSRDDISIVIALGTHRPMTETEITNKTGAAIASEFEIVNVPSWDESQMVYMGTSSNNIPAWVNRAVATADVRIGLGMIAPHMSAGYGGGAKIILPGVCSSQTVDTFHAREADITVNQLGSLSSLIRRDLEQFVGERVGLDFIVNAILTRDNQLYKCVAGDFIRAHRTGVRVTQEVYGVPVAERYPLVISNAYPGQIDLWQSTKAIWCGEMMTRDGGTLVLVTESREGTSVYPSFPHYVGRNPDELKQELDTGEVQDPKAAATAICIGRMKRRIKFALVSSGLKQQDADTMGFAYYETVEEAIASELKGPDKNNAIGVLTHTIGVR
jgi:nickel-dependent lactate racemase